MLRMFPSLPCPFQDSLGFGRRNGPTGLPGERGGGGDAPGFEGAGRGRGLVKGPPPGYIRLEGAVGVRHELPALYLGGVPGGERRRERGLEVVGGGFV